MAIMKSETTRETALARSTLFEELIIAVHSDRNRAIA